MSLAISVVQNDFIIATSDSAVTLFVDKENIQDLKNIGINASVGEMIATDGKSEKVHPMTNKVLLSSCGNSILTEVFRVELFAKLKETDDLKKCGEVAQSVLSDMMKGSVQNKDLILLVLKEKLQIPDDVFPIVKESFQDELMRLLPNSDEITELIKNFTAYLVGFNDDGTTGLIDVRSNKYMECTTKGYPFFIDGYHPGFSKDSNNPSEFQKALMPPSEHRTLETFIERMTYVHAKISKLSPVNVSSDCTFHVFTKETGNIEYKKFIIETSDFYDRL